MRWTFVEDARRGIDADLGAGWDGFTQALADSISSIPPRNSGIMGLSTFWIDHATFLIARVEDGQALASGNSTELVREGDMIIARSMYEAFADQAMSVSSFRQLLAEWRVEVCQHRHDFEIGGIHPGVDAADRETPPTIDLRPPELSVKVSWRRTAHACFPFGSQVDGVWWVLRVNNFPDHPVLTLFVDGARRFDIDDRPHAWKFRLSRPRLNRTQIGEALEPIASWIAYGSEVGRPCGGLFCCA